MAKNITITVHLDSELTREQVWTILEMIHTTWPYHPDPLKKQVDDFLLEAQKNKGEPDEAAHFTIWDGKRAIAHSAGFRRDIYTPAGTISVMALADVVVRPEHQGKGLGTLVSRRAFEEVDKGRYEAALFMTESVDFYKRLGARPVENEWINSRDDENPNADPWPKEPKMIYPADFPWPDGKIDLNGTGY